MSILEKGLAGFKKQIEDCILNASYKNTKGKQVDCNNGHNALGSFIRSFFINHSNNYY